MLKTIIAFADTHNLPLPNRLEELFDENDYVFFLGDGLGDTLGKLAFHSGFHPIKGNVDAADAPEEEILEIDGVRILLTHGHNYNVKRDLVSLLHRAKETNCNAVFYGHTHFAEIDRVDDITLICPGAICNPLSGNKTYAYATIANGQFLAKIVNLT